MGYTYRDKKVVEVSLRFRALLVVDQVLPGSTEGTIKVKAGTPEDELAQAVKNGTQKSVVTGERRELA
jgi:hypothetical protein